MFKPRVQPPRCASCGRVPWLCESCGDYQCACLPWWVAQRRKPKTAIRQHYDPSGQPYKAQFLDGPLEQYPTEEEDEAYILDLLSAPFGTA